MTLPDDRVTGLVLAGGRGSRMGGLDKGLQTLRGTPLALHALQRLAPQVGRVAINANRHLADYRTLGAPVWPDVLADHPGPLAGFLTGLERCETLLLMTVPCDSPLFPLDLVARLAAALDTEGTDIALPRIVENGMPRVQPVFALLRAEPALHDHLLAFLQSGQRKVEAWAATQRCSIVDFDDADAFVNANTLDELQRLGSGVDSDG